MTDTDATRPTLPAAPDGAALTYRGPAHTGVPRVHDLPGVGAVVTVTDAEVREQERVDTADLRLGAAGIELVVERTVPDRGGAAPESAAWVLRLPDGGPDEELRVALPAPQVEGVDPQEVPADVDDLVRRVHGGAPLRPVGRIRVVRRTLRLQGDATGAGGGGAELALVHRDQVQVATLGARTDVESWTEVTVLPGAAGAALRQELDAAVRATGMTRAPSASRARLAALLAGSAPAEPVRHRGRAGSAGALLLAYLGERVDTLTAREHDLREDRPDAVHRMRVEARRIRSALRTYGRLLEGPRPAHLAAELRWFGRAVAGERDAEVQEQRLADRLAELDDELVLGPVQAELTRYFARTRAEARAAVLEVVDGPRYAALQGALRRLLADPPLSSRARRQAASVMPALAGRTARRLERRMEAALAELTAGRDATTALHAARKTGKQLRYATEVVRPAAGREARAFATRLKTVQRLLGDHQDAVVARGTLRTLGARAGAEGGNGFTVGVLHGHETARMRKLEARLPGVWAQVWTRRSRRWMRR